MQVDRLRGWEPISEEMQASEDRTGSNVASEDRTGSNAVVWVELN